MKTIKVRDSEHMAAVLAVLAGAWTGRVRFCGLVPLTLVPQRYTVWSEAARCRERSDRDMVVKVVYGRRMVWGESVTEHEHQVGLAAYEAAIGAGLRGIYPDARISVQGEGHDSAARVTVDGEDVSETPRVEWVLGAAFLSGCRAIAAETHGINGEVSQ